MEPIKCPSCGAEMKFRGVSPDLACPTCGTVFFPLKTLESIAAGLSDRIEYGDAESRECSVCGAEMRRTSLLHHDGWLMDYCPGCDGFFLDRLEAAEMQGSAPDRHTGEYHIGGHNVRYEKFLVTSIMDSVPYLRISVRFRKPLPWGVRAYSERWTDPLTALAGRHGKTAVISGDKHFDDRFIVTGRESKQIRDCLLTSELRAAMLTFLEQRRIVDNPLMLEILDDRIMAVDGPVAFDAFYDVAVDPHGVVREMIRLSGMIGDCAVNSGEHVG
jgi:Zn-finger nucleic acid-binding protein